MARRRQLDPHTKDPRDTLELIALLLQRSSYVVPTEGRGTKPGLQATDVAMAVGYMNDKSAKRVILAVARRAGPREIAQVAQQVYGEVAQQLRRQAVRPLDLRKPADRWRLRIVVYDAAHDLVWPEHRQSWKSLAKMAKMRQSSYVLVHKLAMSVLQSCLNGGRSDLRHTLYRVA